MTDLLIRNALIIDGTGKPGFRGDVTVSGQCIQKIAPAIDPSGAYEVVDAKGNVLCPGFIDIQSHSIISLLHDPRSPWKVSQGVTTEIMGEAWTPAPFGGRAQGRGQLSSSDFYDGKWGATARTWANFRDWFDALAKKGTAVNVGSFVGGGTLREYACGWEKRAATTAEIDVMCRVMEESMRQGAFGLATALIYPPGSYATTDELVEIARVAGRNGGLYISHIRDEGEHLLGALDEAIEIGQRSSCPIEIYHLKAAGKPWWNLMPQAIARIDAARASGIDIEANMYPYTGAGTFLSVLFPDWASEGGRLFERLSDRTLRERLQREITARPNAFALDPARILPAGFTKKEHHDYLGKSLAEIAAARGQDWASAAIDLLIAEQQQIFSIFLLMDEANLGRQIRQSWIKISSDAPGGVNPANRDEPVHPRSYGTFPRVLAKYVREEKLLTLENAIRKMTGAVAARLGLSDRGVIREGCFADLVLFDPARVQDHATFTDSHRFSTGISDVWVNGKQVFAAGAQTEATSGMFVRNAKAR